MPDDSWVDSEEVLDGPVVTPGFIAFVAVLLAPAFLALAIYAGAALVADEVYASEAGSDSSQTGFNVSVEGDREAAGWKRGLVGVCPLH